MGLLVLRRIVAVVMVPAVLGGGIVLPRPGAAAGIEGGGPGAPPAGPRQLALLVVPAPDVPARVATAVREAAARRLADAAVAVTAGATPPAPAGRSIDAARRTFAAGLAALDALEPEAARARFEAVTRALEADGRLAAAAPELLEAPLHLGVIALGLGEREAADVAFTRAVRLAPDRGLPPGRFSPAAEQAHALARVRLGILRPALVQVEARPDPAELFVDGVHRGRTPLALPPLAPGGHVLFAQAPARGAVALRVDATEFGPDVVEIAVPAGSYGPSLVGLARALASGERAAAVAPAGARALGDALGARRLAVVWLEGSAAGLVAGCGILDLDQGLWEDEGRIGPFADEDRLGQRLAGWIAESRPEPVAALGSATLVPDWRDAAGTARRPEPAGPLVADPVGLPPLGDEPARGEERPWYRRWYWWALIGAAVAGGVAVGLAAAGGDGGGGADTGSVVVGP
jgi:hypothetical protein